MGITVGDIRKAIEGLPDQMPAVVERPSASAEGGLGAPPTRVPVAAVRADRQILQIKIER